MDVPSIVQAIESSPLGDWMRTSVKAMPFVEATHVLAASVVFGTVFIVDLRLLGFPNTRRPFTRVADEMLKLTWGAFVVSVITGVLMFAANGMTYYGNTAFKLKMLALLLAGLNMAFFHGFTLKSVSRWNMAATPFAARFAGAASILIWVVAIVLARWIGFTKGYDFSVPDNIDLNQLNFDFSGQ
jgi:hypothetical protein